MPGPDFIPSRHHPILEKFSKTVWGNAQAVLKRGNGYEFIELGEYFEAFEYLFAGPLREVIYVGDEYRVARAAFIGEHKYHRGAYVTGHPGIGKSLFLLYMLVACLGEKSAVALQAPNGCPFYLLFNDGRFSIHSLDSSDPLDACGFVWALSDSNAHVIIPSGIFFGAPKRIRVIHTAPPESDRWKEWSKQIGARRYVMDMWPGKELADLAALLELAVARMTTLGKKWGGAPRNLLQWLEQEDKQIERDIRRCAMTAVEQCRPSLAGIENNDILDETSAIYFSRPQKNGETIDREHTSASVPTQALAQILAEELRLHKNDTRLEFFDALSRREGTRSTAKFIFESWFHGFLAAGNTVQCEWVRGAGPASLPRTTKVFPPAPDATRTAIPPFLWVAPYGFPGIDSTLVLGNVIYVFQVIGSNDRVPFEGLQALQANLPDSLKDRDIPLNVIFVGNTAERVARQWTGQLSHADMPIGWSTVDPIVDGVTPSFRV